MRWSSVTLVLALATCAVAQESNPDEAVRQALASHKLRARFDGTPVDEVLDAVRDLAQVNVAVVASSTDDKRVTLKASDASARSVLEAIAASDETFTYEVWRGFLFVSSKELPRKVPPQADLSDDARRSCTEHKLTASFVDVSVSEFLDYLSDATKLSFSAAQGVADLHFTLRVKDAPAGAVLDVVCRLLQLRVQRAGDVNVLKAR
jgi:hypothetical protein